MRFLSPSAWIENMTVVRCPHSSQGDSLFSPTPEFPFLFIELSPRGKRPHAGISPMLWFLLAPTSESSPPPLLFSCMASKMNSSQARCAGLASTFFHPNRIPSRAPCSEACTRLPRLALQTFLFYLCPSCYRPFFSPQNRLGFALPPQFPLSLYK